MTAVGEAFHARFGSPDPAAPSGLRFPGAVIQDTWEGLTKEIGAGWYLEGFVYLFGEGLDALQPCVEAWEFMLPAAKERRVIGRNAYGALLVAEDLSSKGLSSTVGLLDPVQVRYWRDPGVGLMNLIGHYLPEDKVPGFLDSRMYDAWHGATGDRLDLDEGLVIKTPLSMGGTIEAENFQPEPLVAYYRTTAEIYRDVKKQGKAAKRKKKK